MAGKTAREETRRMADEDCSWWSVPLGPLLCSSSAKNAVTTTERRKRMVGIGDDVE